jgi:hypothetical protein
MAFLMVCEQYDLNPILREIYPFIEQIAKILQMAHSRPLLRRQPRTLLPGRMEHGLDVEVLVASRA